MRGILNLRGWLDRKRDYYRTVGTLAKYHYDDQVKVWHDGEYLNIMDARADTAIDRTADVVGFSKLNHLHSQTWKLNP